MAIPRLKAQDTALLVVDMQEKLLSHMRQADRLIRQVATLIDGCRALEVPILATEQYRKGLGATVGEISDRLSGADCRAEKLKFSACIEPVREVLSDLGSRCVLVCGIEAHVCVLQTCLDLAEAGYLPFVVVDAVSSRRSEDQEVALRRLAQAAVTETTVESALLELVHEAGSDRFKTILPLIK